MGFSLISGPYNAFLWNLVNHVMITFHDIFSSTNLYNSYFTGLLLHVVYNTWLTPVTACGSQSTACGIEIRHGDRERLGLLSTVLFRKIFVLRIHECLFFIKKIISNKIKINYIKIQNNTHFIDERAFGLCRGWGDVGVWVWGFQ